MTLLNDDRAGRWLDLLFVADVPSFALAVVRHMIREFAVALDELHNDSTTVTFHGSYAEAAREKQQRGRRTLAITWGHNKDHRPDLKQLLYVLTVTNDGGVPVHFRVESGNRTDDQTHRETWDLLCQLAGRCDFLYVADCKLATSENMAYLHQHQGRFVSVLPKTRAEDETFRESLAQGRVTWKPLWNKTDEEGQVMDRFSVSQEPALSAEGYRLVWYHSARKAELDALARSQRITRALSQLAELRQKLQSPRTRYRQQAKVSEAVAEILQSCGASRWIKTEVRERALKTYRQERRGRPTQDTRYVKQVSLRFDLTYRLDDAQIAEDAQSDGVFPLITNVLEMPELDLLLAYKHQPKIEKRFAQFKTDYEVAPVYLKEIRRIQALLCLYFLALVVEALLERELRQAMAEEGIESLPMYPEGRACRRPTTRRLIDLFENVRRYTLVRDGRSPVVLVTELTRLQRRLLRLLSCPVAEFDG
jgi:transposase